MKRFGRIRSGNFVLIAALLLCAGCAAARTPGKSSPPKETETIAPAVSPLAPSTRTAFLPMGVVVSGTNEVESPNWVTRGLSRTTGIGPGFGQAAGSILQASAGGLGGYAGAGIVMGYLMYLPVGAAIGAIAGTSASHKWQPCLDELTRELRDLEAFALLSRELADTLGKYCPVPPQLLAPDAGQEPPAARRELKSLLKAEISRIAIRECRPRGFFCVEVALKAQLQDIASQKVSYDRVLVYSAISPLQRQAGEVQALKPSPCRKMEEYCGAAGRQVFREEVATGLRSLVDKLLDDLGLFSAPGPHVVLLEKMEEFLENYRSKGGFDRALGLLSGGYSAIILNSEG